MVPRNDSSPRKLFQKKEKIPVVPRRAPMSHRIATPAITPASDGVGIPSSGRTDTGRSSTSC